jgi:hypothetical protein
MPPWPILDEEFYTERFAVITDRRLSYSYSVAWWTTLFIGLWSLFVNHGYLQLDEELRGVIRPRLNNRPTAVRHKNPAYEYKFSPALRLDDPITSGTGESLMPEYCQQEESRFDGEMEEFEDASSSGGAGICEHWDPLSVSRPMGPDGIFIVTRLQERQQVAVCRTPPHHGGGSGILCPKVEFASLRAGGTRPMIYDGFTTHLERQIFPQDVESFVLQADGNIEAHTFAASSTICGEHLSWKHNNQELNGLLVGPTPLCRSPARWWASWEGIMAVWDCINNPPASEILRNISAGRRDAFPLQLWLKAAGIALDDRSDTHSSKAGLDTFRHEGMVIEVSYEYSNTEGMSFLGALGARISCTEPSEFSYKIKVERVAGSEFKMEDVVLQEQSCELICPPTSTEADRSPVDPDRCCGTRRVVQRLHGILIKFRHSGTAGQFSFAAVPGYLIYALGSVTVVKTALDFAWMFLFPMLGWSDYNRDVFKPALKRAGSGNSGTWRSSRLGKACRWCRKKHD